MIDHVGIYGSRVAEGLWAFNVGLVMFSFWSKVRLYVCILLHSMISGQFICFKTRPIEQENFLFHIITDLD